MGKGLGVVLVILGLVVVLVLVGIGQYNGIVSASVEVDKQWGNVQAVLQRRYDLIPNLAEAVKGQLQHEEQVFGDIAKARSALLSAQSPEQQVGAANQMESALGRLLVVVENYPELKSSENINTLMVEIEGTENRIAVERNNYNGIVATYNKKVRTFPGVLFARMFGYGPREIFQAQQGADVAPRIDLTK